MPKQSNSKLKQIHALLQAMPQQNRSQLLGKLHGFDPDFVLEAVNKNLLNKGDQQPITSHTEIEELENIELEEPIPDFSCLQNLSAPMIQKVFHEIDRIEWLKALKIAEPEFKDYLLKHLSIRARSDLAEDLRLLGPVRLQDASDACDLIIRTAWHMQKDGKINGLID